MKKEKFLRAVGNIDDSTLSRFCDIEDSLKKGTLPKRGIKKRAVIVAACVVVLMASCAIVVPYVIDGGAVKPDILTNALYDDVVVTPIYGNVDENRLIEGILGTPDTSEAEVALVSRTVYRLQLVEYADYRSLRVIEAERVGAYISPAKVLTYTHYFLENKDKGKAVLNAELYEIKGVDRSAAVCVKYTERHENVSTEHYYTFVNPDIGAKSKAELYEKLGATEHLSTYSRSVIAKIDGENTLYTEYELSVMDNSALEELLMSCDGEAIVREDSHFDRLAKERGAELRLFIDLPSVGQKKIMLVVLDNGYILQTVAGKAFLLNVGVECTNEMIELVKSRGEVIVRTEGDIAVAETLVVNE